MTISYQSILSFLMDNSYFILFLSLGIGIIGLVLKIIFNLNPYKRILKLLRKDYRQGIKALNKLEDKKVKKKIIVDGKYQLDKQLYKKVKDYLVMKGILTDLLVELKKKNTSKQEKMTACQALGEIGTPQALDYCTIALYDNNREIKEAVLDILAKHSTPKVIDTLISYFNYCEDEKMLGKLKEVFFEIGTDALHQLSQIALKGNEKYRYWAVNLLIEMNLSETEERRVGKLFMKLLNDNSIRIRRFATRNLTNYLKNEQAVKRLTKKLEDDAAVVRNEAVKKLPKLDLEEEKVGIYLFKRITDDNQQVRFNACRELVKLGPRGIDYLIKATENKKMKKTAIQVLDELDTEYLISIVKQLYVKKEKVKNITIKKLLSNQSEEAHNQEVS